MRVRRPEARLERIVEPPFVSHLDLDPLVTRDARLDAELSRHHDGDLETQ